MHTTKEIPTKKLTIFSISIFLLFSVWYFVLLFKNLDSTSQSAQVWAATYQVIAWLGVVFGFYFAKLWGGWSSLMGRANLAFALGLLAQSFGQIVFSYFFFIGIEAPYPSLADIGFFGSIPFYIYGVLMLGKASGARLSFKSFSNRLQAFLIPLLILGVSYVLFLKDYEFDWNYPLTIFLDFGYPFGQAIYISLAFVTFLLTRNFLGGIMRKPVMIFMAALFVQFIADYTFLFEVSRGTYTGGQEIDFLYMTAYLVMTLALIKFGSVFYKIKNSN